MTNFSQGQPANWEDVQYPELDAEFRDLGSVSPNMENLTTYAENLRVPVGWYVTTQDDQDTREIFYRWDNQTNVASHVFALFVEKTYSHLFSCLKGNRITDEKFFQELVVGVIASRLSILKSGSDKECVDKIMNDPDTRCLMFKGSEFKYSGATYDGSEMINLNKSHVVSTQIKKCSVDIHDTLKKLEGCLEVFKKLKMC